MSSTDHRGPSRGTLVSQLSREIVQLHARLYGRGPTKARSYLQSDYAICVLEEIFTIAERTLIDAGAGEHVGETRKKFQDAVSEEFVAVAERITGREVKVFLSQVDIEADLALECFLFAPLDGAGAATAAGDDVAVGLDVGAGIGDGDAA